MSGFFARLRRRPAAPVKPDLPPGIRVYCIGDIHGRADLLEQMHGMIRSDCAGFGGHRMVVYLGDYIDRGQFSRQVLDLLLEKPLPGFERIHLRGNHEQALLDFLEYPDHAANWLNFGGLATLLSYGVRLEGIPGPGDLVRLSVDLRRNLPPAHAEFLNGLEPLHRVGAYCFVHAGIRPGVPISRQDVNDLLWIRDEFTRCEAPHEKIVVHGHSFTGQAQLLPNRIGIDTGAYLTGVLTCVVLEGHSQRLLQTGSEGESERAQSGETGQAARI